MQFRDYQNIHELLRETTAAIPDEKAFAWIPSPGQTESVTWREFYSQVLQAAKSLIALGVQKDDKVNIISYTSYKWLLTDQAIMSIGACTVASTIRTWQRIAAILSIIPTPFSSLWKTSPS